MPDDLRPPQFSADQPLVDPADDKLDRNRFSEEIAKSLANWKGRDSLILSLSGEWGSGKTTIKNFVIRHLGTRATIVEFNPWQWSGQDKLLEGFLWQIGKALGREDVAKKTRRLASKWAVFASITKFGGEVTDVSKNILVPILAVSAFSSITGALLKAAPWFLWIGIGAFVIFLCWSFLSAIVSRFSSALSDWATYREISLEDLRSEIDAEMRKLDKPIVVFIDDIDRLTKDEVKLLIQLVKANAQFPNLVYVLLFQRDIVVKALSDLTFDDGAKYLRKIVQVEFEVPLASQSQMQKLLTQGLDRIINQADIKVRWDQARWQRIFLDDLWPYFKNLRDINRFLGSFEFYFALHINEGVLEVNPIDLIAVETLRMFDNDAFRKISNSFLGEQQSLSRQIFGREEKTRKFNEFVDDTTKRPTLSKAENERLKHLLFALFPQSDHSINELKRDFRVGDPSSFSKYFQVTLDTAKPTASDINQFIVASSDRNLLVEQLKLTIRNNTIEDFLDLIFVTRDELPLANMATVVTALFDIGDSLPDPVRSMFSTGLDVQCTRIIYHRLKDEDQQVSTDILWRAYVDTTGFILPIRNLALEDKRTRQREQKTAFVISDDRLDAFVNLILSRIRTRAVDLSLLDNKNCALVLYRWADWAGNSEVQIWISGVVKEPLSALKLLRHLMTKSIVNGVREERLLHGNSVERLINLESLYEPIKLIPPDRLDAVDTANIALLTKAVELKSEGKPYEEIQARDVE